MVFRLEDAAAAAVSQGVDLARPFHTNLPSKGNFFMNGDYVAGIVGLACLSFVWVAFTVQMLCHIFHYVRPAIQKCYIRIIMIAPFYATTSYLVLQDAHYKGVISLFLVMFEGYVMWTFMALMVIFVGGLTRVGKNLQRKFDEDPTAFGFYVCPCTPRLFTFSSPNSAWSTWRFCVLQFLVIRPVVAIASIFFEREHRIIQADVFILSISIATVTLAMIGLLNIYKALSSDAFDAPPLAALRPVTKFLALKLAIFFTVYQEVTFHLLVASGVIDSFYCKDETVTLGELQASSIKPGQCRRDIPAQGIRTFAVITLVEMVLFCIYHYFTFSHTDYCLGPDYDFDSYAYDDSNNGISEDDFGSRDAIDVSITHSDQEEEEEEDKEREEQTNATTSLLGRKISIALPLVDAAASQPQLCCMPLRRIFHAFNLFDGFYEDKWYLERASIFGGRPQSLAKKM